MRKITIRLGEYVEEEKRRERRGGRAVAAAAIVVALVIALSRGTTTTTTPPPNGNVQTDTTKTTVTTTTVTATTTTTTTATATTATTATTTTVPTTTTTTTTTTVAPPPTPTPAHLAPVPRELAFGAQLAGTASAARLVRVRNDGEQPLSITRLAATGDAFRLSHDCTEALSRGESCSAAIVFSPAVAGRYRGGLAVQTSGGAASVALTGAARPIPPVDLGVLDFGSAVVKSPRPPRPLRFANSRPAPIAFGKTSVAGPFAVFSDRCGGATIPPGGTCDVVVELRATTIGPSKGELRLADAHGDPVAFSALSGNTTPVPTVDVAPEPKIEIAPRSLIFTRNARQALPIVVTNRGPVPVTITVEANALPFGYVVDKKACDNRTLKPGESCRILVTALPIAYERGSAMRIVVRYGGRAETIGVSTPR